MEFLLDPCAINPVKLVLLMVWGVSTDPFIYSADRETKGISILCVLQYFHSPEVSKKT